MRVKPVFVWVLIRDKICSSHINVNVNYILKYFSRQFLKNEEMRIWENLNKHKI